MGYHRYGAEYRTQISETIRRAAEQCDSLQSFLLLHSMGGGTGSGLGTFVLELLKDEYPEVYKFVTAIYPSEDDDVVTSPYNSVLAMRQLTEFADCVLPVENQALHDIVSKINQVCFQRRGGSKEEEQRKKRGGKEKGKRKEDIDHNPYNK